MNKLKLFLENLLIYGFGGVISKLVPVIMVPVITWIMPTTGYVGISDMSNTIVQFASAFAVMGMYDAMYRLFFEKNEEKFKKTVCSTALIFTVFTSIMVFILMLIFKDLLAQYFLSDRKYAYVIYMSAMATLVGATNTIISAPVRMQNKRKIFLIANTVAPIVSYSVAVPLLLAGHYVIALPLSAVISGVVMEVTFGVINRKWFSFRSFDRKVLKQLLIIAVPLLPNFVIYWIFNSCDKLMVTNMIGIDAAGVYSVGSKLGLASQLIYTAFAGGWQFFAFSTMKEKEQVKNNSSIFEYLGALSYVATAFICALSYLIFHIFKPDYLGGYIIAPYLFLAPLLQMLFQVAANQFLVVKKTWPNLFILLSGAVLNVFINLYLIPVIGIEGAALATLIGYVVSDVICTVVLCRMRLMVVSGKFLLSSLLMAVYFVAWRFLFSDRTLIGVPAMLAFTAIMVLLYRNELKKLKEALKSLRSDKGSELSEERK